MPIRSPVAALGLGGRRRVASIGLAAAALIAAAAPARAAEPPAVLDGDAMWIWIVRKSSEGNPSAIVRKARRNGVETVIVKGADARGRWSQFSPWLVSRLKAGGLRVCAYQFVYGRHPRGEADAGARLARAGADCLLIDAEGAYEGRYRQAQIYLRRLRAHVGSGYPLALASFPYVHYHPGFPYSVFLGPGGAQLNVPQVYWRAIGTSVDRALSITYRQNGLYGRPILPLGQVYQHPPPGQIRRFRELARAYGARGVSWWDWQEASTRDWRSLSAPLGLPLTLVPPVPYPVLSRGLRGDVVVWAQEHLLAAGVPVRIDGVFGRRMREAVLSFQLDQRLAPAGRIGPLTWQALLRYPAPAVSWTRRGHARAASTGGRSAPLSAALPAVRDELGRRGH